MTAKKDENVIRAMIDLDEQAEQVRKQAADEAARMRKDLERRCEEARAELERAKAEAVQEIERKAAAERESQLAELRDQFAKEAQAIRDTPSETIDRAAQAVLLKLEGTSA